MVSDEPTEGRCNAGAGENNEGYCEAWPVTDDDGEPVNGRCRMHGGKNPGPGEGNGNAIDHGATADPTNLFNNLDDEERQWVDAHVQALLEEKPDADETDVERLEVLVTRMLMERRGLGRLLTEGLSRTKVVGQTVAGQPIRDEEAHYLNRVVNDHNQTIRMNLKDWGFLNDPESQKADATQSLVDLLSE